MQLDCSSGFRDYIYIGWIISNTEPFWSGPAQSDQGKKPVGKNPRHKYPQNQQTHATQPQQQHKKLRRKLVTFFTDASLHRCCTGFQVLSNVAHQLVSPPQSSGHLCNEISLCLHHLDRCTVIAIPGRWHSVENPLDCLFQWLCIGESKKFRTSSQIVRDVHEAVSAWIDRIARLRLL